jgi:hypothetical protein
MLPGHLRLSRQCPRRAPKKKHAAPRHPRSPPRPPTLVVTEEVSLGPKWEGDVAGEVEAGMFDVEDGPGAAAAEEEGELAAPSGRRRARRSASSVSYSHFDED